MNQRMKVVVLGLTAGIVGGAVSDYLVPSSVYAQAQKAAPKEIQAQNFVLVNSQGSPVGLFGFNPQSKPIIKLIDERGSVIWTTEVPLARAPPSQSKLGLASRITGRTAPPA
jgi:hypothetical protein